MKKVLAILLVLFVAGFVFAANNSTADLELGTSVGGRYGVKVTEEVIGDGTLGSKVSAFDDEDAVTSVTFDIEEGGENWNKVDLAISYLTNQKIKAIVSVGAHALASDTVGVTTKIGYSVTGDTSGDPVAVLTTAEGATTITFFEEAAITNGMRVDTKAFSITLNTDDYLAATQADDYNTTWTIGLTVN